MNFPETEYREVEIVRDTDDIVIVEFALLWCMFQKSDNDWYT